MPAVAANELWPGGDLSVNCDGASGRHQEVPGPSPGLRNPGGVPGVNTS